MHDGKKTSADLLLGLPLAALLLVGAGCAAPTSVNTEVKTPPGRSENANNALAGRAAVEIKMTAKQFAFEPAEVRVPFGRKIRLLVTSADVAHGLAIPAFNVNVNLAAGQITTIEFIADKKGSYPFFCSVFCGGGHKEMTGTLIVE